MNVAENEKEAVVTMELPGVARENMKIAFEGGVLSISGRAQGAQLPEGAHWVRNEMYAGTFRRDVTSGEACQCRCCECRTEEWRAADRPSHRGRARPREISIR